MEEFTGKKDFIPFRYQGQYEDVEIGLYYNRFRYYDPEQGNYKQIDPIGLAGGNPTLYGYVRDSNKSIDIFGLAECHGKTSKGDLKHYRGTDKSLTHEATSNSFYTHIDPKTGRAVQNAIYDSNGNVIGHVDFKNHGIESGHWNELPLPGDPSSFYDT